MFREEQVSLVRLLQDNRTAVGYSGFRMGGAGRQGSGARGGRSELVGRGPGLGGAWRAGRPEVAVGDGSFE